MPSSSDITGYHTYPQKCYKPGLNALDPPDPRKFQTLPARQSRRPAIGTPSDFRIVSESYTLSLNGITNLVHGRSAGLQRYGALNRQVTNGEWTKVSDQQGTLRQHQCLKHGNSNIGFLGMIDAVAEKVKDIFQIYPGRKFRSSRSMSRSPSRTKLGHFALLKAGKSSLARPVVCTDFKAYGNIISKNSNCQSNSIGSKVLLRLHKVIDAFETTASTGLVKLLTKFQHADRLLSFMPRYPSKSNRNFIMDGESAKKSIEIMKTLSSEQVTAITDHEDALPISETLGQLEIYWETTGDLEDGDSAFRNDDDLEKISTKSKQRRSHSTPESDRDRERFTSYTRALDKMGSSWLAKLYRFSSYADSFSVPSSITDSEFGFHKDNLSLSSMEGKLLKEQEDSFLELNHSFFLDHFYDGSNMNAECDTESLSVLPVAESFELPFPASIVDAKFSTTRNTGGHIRDVIQRLRDSIVVQRVFLDDLKKDENPFGHLRAGSRRRNNGRSEAGSISIVAERLKCETSSAADNSPKQRLLKAEIENCNFGKEMDTTDAKDAEQDSQSADTRVSFSDSGDPGFDSGISHRDRTSSNFSNESFQY